MRNLYTALQLILFVTSVGNAQTPETPPKGMENGEITVVLKDGSKSIVSTNEFKVVPRVKYPVKKIEPQIVEIKELPKVNRVSVYAGLMPNALDVDRTGEDSADVKVQNGLAVGVSYARKVYEDISVTGLVARGIYRENKNLTGLVGAGYDW